MQFDDTTPDELYQIEQFELIPCRICSRKFRADIIEKHESICLKASKRKPKIFDSGKMRAKGTGIPISKTIRPGEIVPREPNKDERLIRAEKKRDNWRVKHKEFINTIRSAKAYQNAISKGGPSMPHPLPPSTIDPDLILCQYCNRRFNESAAERHIPFCREKSERERLKQIPNRSTKKPNQKPVATLNSTYQRKSGQMSISMTQQPLKSPAASKGEKGDGELRNEFYLKLTIGSYKLQIKTAGSLSNTTRSLESPTTIKTPAKRPSSRSSSRKRSSMSSANAEAGIKNRGRYDNFNSGFLHDKPHSPALSSGPEDACNSTFDVEDSQHQLLAYVTALKSDTNRSATQLHISGDGHQSLRSHSSHSVNSRGAISRHSSITTNGSIKNISSGVPKDRSPPLNNNPAFPNQAATLRTGRTYQHYMDAQAFSNDLVKSQSPLTSTANNPVVWPKRVGSRMPPPLIPEIAPMSIKKATRISNSHTSRVTSSDSFGSRIDLDRADRIGNREQILESNHKFGKPNPRWVLPSGIPVRAT
ncbi:unnamed protein product [Hydatigera taeniaeformis]|uniref:Zinc finger C2HC domain-containing protein 1A n=1 Tax=Hydatigena taeniaeformis TaxID=6205 RepID=A0A158RDR0_HYDTA|nr:unnamed protein product [Hydatigera taeniaeformis]